jgi:hypothetical protein
LTDGSRFLPLRDALLAKLVLAIGLPLTAPSDSASSGSAVTASAGKSRTTAPRRAMNLGTKGSWTRQITWLLRVTRRSMRRGPFPPGAHAKFNLWPRQVKLNPHDGGYIGSFWTSAADGRPGGQIYTVSARPGADGAWTGVATVKRW